MLTEMDSSLVALGIASYGISITSIEDVFLKITHGSAHKEEQHEAPTHDGNTTMIQVASKGSGSPVTTMVPSSAPGTPTHVKSPMETAFEPTKGGLEAVRAAARAEQTGFTTFIRHFWALLVKRWQYTTRDGKALLYQLFLPAILIAIGLALINVGVGAAPASYQLSTAQFNADARTNADTPKFTLDVPVFAFKAGKNVDSTAVPAFFAGMPAANVSISSKTFATVTALPDPAGTNWISSMIDSPRREYAQMSAYLISTRGESAASRYGAFLLTTNDTIVSSAVHNAEDLFTNNDNTVTPAIFFNSTGFHTPAVLMNLFNSRLYAVASGNGDARITTRNHPLPPTERQKTLFAGLLVFTAAIIMVIAFSFVASSMALFVTR
jgi:hypothetical protein